MPPNPVERRLAAIMFTDIVGYTALMAESEEKGLRVRERHRAFVRPLVEQYHGEPIEAYGDQSLSVFPSALDAVNCGLAIENRLDETADLKLHIGIHLGDVVVLGNEVSGDGVNIASRICSLSEGGGLCVSGEVYQSVRNQPHIRATPLGEHDLKNVGRPVAAFALTGTATPPRSSSAPPEPRRLRSIAAATATLVLLLALGIWISWPRPLGLVLDLAGLTSPTVNPSLPDKPSIAVLPFTNMSGDPEQEYFSDGITEDLTTELARYSGLFVIARNSAFTYKGERVSVGRVGRELGVRYVLEGSVRKADDRVRITAQLIDATTDGHLWSERYDRELSDILTLQSEIAQEILGSLRLQIHEAEARRLAQEPTDNLTAMDALWRGRYHRNRQTRKDNLEARTLFERAIELDPDFANAYANLSYTYLTEFGNGWTSDPYFLERATELGERAIALDSTEYSGHLALTWVSWVRGRPHETIAGSRRVIELNPNVAFAHALLGIALAQEGQLIEATQSIQRASRLNPLPDNTLLMIRASVNFAAGRRQQAIELLEQVRVANPDNIISRIALAASYEQDGRHEDASAAVQEVLSVTPDLTVERAMSLIPSLETTVSAQEFAEYPHYLRKAGLR